MELISFFALLSLALDACDAVPFAPVAIISQSLQQRENNKPSATTTSLSSTSTTSKVTSQSSFTSSTQSIFVLTSKSLSTSDTQSATASSGTPDSTNEESSQSVALGGNGQPIPTSQPAICNNNAKACWGNYSVETNTEITWPQTGRTVEYNLTLTNTTCSPDGVKKTCLLINNQYPGPTITANWGDWVKVTVNNHMQDNGTNIHWHGVTQRTTNDQDGTSGITECPIAPGQSRTYLWQATSYGTAWYHSHYSSQYGDGLAGAIVINGPSTADYDIDMGPISLAELYKPPPGGGSATIDSLITHQGPLLDLPENVLFNGTNVNANGAGKRMIMTVQPNMRYKMRFINAGVVDLYKVGVDGHMLQVTAVDSQAVEPYYTQWVSIGVGQRFEAILTTNSTPDNYWLRAVTMNCAVNMNDGKGDQNAIISYTNAKQGVLPVTKIANITDECVDDKVTPVPAVAIDPTQFDPRHIPVASPFRVTSVAEGYVYRWSIGNNTAVVNWEYPLLQRFVNGNQTLTPEDNINAVDGPGDWAFWYIQNNFYEAHPIHMHGNIMHILAQGDGNWDQNASSLAFANPIRRDTFMLPAGGYTIFAFRTSNPGLWMLHCHIAWHTSEGLATTMLVRKNDIPIQTIRVKAIEDGCTAWRSFSQKSAFKQVGSGV